MKKVFVLLALVIYCSNGFAQQTKKALFIGIYEKNKRGICGDYEMVQMEVANYAEYAIKRIEFQEEYKKQNASTKFVDVNESVICYKYEKKISGWNCNSNVISVKIGKSLEDCNKQLANQLAQNTDDFTTPPITFFTWQSKSNSKLEYTKDYGGVNGKFIAVDLASKSMIVAQLTNTTKDKLAYVVLKTEKGLETVEYIYPNTTLTRKYETKNLEIKIVYLDNNKPKPTKSIIDGIKEFVRETVTNDNGTIKSKPAAGIGVRG